MTEQMIQLPMPPSNNQLHAYSRKTGVYLTKAYREWKKAAGWALLSQRIRPMRGEIDVTIRAVRPDKRRRDVANLEKAIGDLLVAHGIIEDDSKIVTATQVWVSDDIAEGVSVTIKGRRPGK